MIGRSKSYNEQLKEEMERKGYEDCNHAETVHTPVKSEPKREVHPSPGGSKPNTDNNSKSSPSNTLSNLSLISGIILLVVGIAIVTALVPEGEYVAVTPEIGLGILCAVGGFLIFCFGFAIREYEYDETKKRELTEDEKKEHERCMRAEKRLTEESTTRFMHEMIRSSGRPPKK